MNFMEIAYIVLWGAMAAYCYFMAHKVHNVLYLAGAFFTFMFGWKLADQLITTVDLSSGIFGWIFRGISLAFLIAFVVIYILIRRKKKD